MIAGRIFEVLLYIRHLKENLLREKLQLNKSLYLKQLVTVKCHISIYILEKG